MTDAQSFTSTDAQSVTGSHMCVTGAFNTGSHIGGLNNGMCLLSGLLCT
jgi:hypothetical protein